MPPGTYLLIGASQLNVSIGGIFVLNLENVAIRFSGSGGGGACTSVVKSTDTTKIFRMRMYKPAGENTSVKTDGVNLWAIKIK